MAIDRIKVKKEADKLLTAGKVDRAIEEFHKLVDDNPKDYSTLNQIGDLYVQIGRSREGVEIHKRLGTAYERDGFHARAAAIFQKVVRNAPEDIDAAQRLADLYRQMNKVTDAVKVHLQVAEHFQKKGLIKRALEEFNKVVDLDPKNLKMKVKLADLYNKEGMKDRAAGIYLEVAESLAMEQMHGEANQILERAKAMISTPQVFLTQSRLGVIQGDYANAAQHLREGLASNPRDTDLLEALAEIELRSGHPDRALEALTEIAQIPEKSLPLAEKALRNLVNADRAEEGLRLFTPIARELARRGSGDTVGRSLRAAMQNHMGIEAWTLLAEIAHQSGNRADQIHALQSAYGLAHQGHDQALIGHLSGQLRALGAVPDASAPPPASAPQPGFAGTLQSPAALETVHGGESELDPVRRLRMEQFTREAEALLRSGSTERAVETFKKALELDPSDLTLIEAIVAVHRTTGHLTKVQMQYVQSAQALIQLGRKREAAQLLDMAEQLFPGSTRIHRRTMGLPEPGARLPESVAPVSMPAPMPVPMPPPPPAPAPAPAPKAALPPPAAAAAPIALPAPPPEMEELIGLDLSGFEPPPPAQVPAPLVQAPAPPAQAPAPPVREAIPMGEGLPALADPFASAANRLPLPSEPAALDASDLSWMDDTLADLAPEPASFSAPTAQLPPMPTGILSPEVVEALPPLSAAVEPPAIPEELASLLGDIDFQLDYGSPEEAKAEIDVALKQFPGHPELEARLERSVSALQKLGLAAKASALDEGDFANSFFDLTDVLGTALMDEGEDEEMHDATHVVEKIQSVDELFSAFREGVEKQVKGDDYDTHYNLGIAYKEMALIEPAIEEFKIAMGDPERTLECCSMLSICEQDRGDLDAAVAWLRQGIEAPGFPPEDSIGLRYDLAEIYLQQGQTAQAASEFKAVRDMDPDYRDVAARLA
ncbi:tetratricopeptide repeat protein [Geothrix fuzhouensis]|uniref:tetratricopeptide repeat protein n=1 Tax=Geothrix fuzhouensis TaxID=2966451 RepID=UPI0021497D7D|nr:tetratricopeptide repeat protein [Geothrix fuzhouensis]